MKQTILSLTTIAALALTGSAQALTPPKNKAASREDAAKRAQQNAGGGRVLGVKEVMRGDQPFYDVKILSGGKVRVLRIEKAE